MLRGLLGEGQLSMSFRKALVSKNGREERESAFGKERWDMPLYHRKWQSGLSWGRNVATDEPNFSPKCVWPSERGEPVPRKSAQSLSKQGLSFSPSHSSHILLKPRLEALMAAWKIIASVIQPGRGPTAAA